MTTADKTKQRLVDSMRKSKTSATRKTSPATRATTKKKTPARRAPAKAAKPVVQAIPVTAAVMKAVTWQLSTDSYQSDGRIWPD